MESQYYCFYQQLLLTDDYVLTDILVALLFQ